jgi:hypothetical protein
LAIVRWEVSLQELFHLPLSEETYSQFCELDLFMNLLPENQHRDTWKYIWGGNEYSSQKAYRHLIVSSRTHPAFRWIWSSVCQAKHKVFYWLLLKNRINTRGLLRKKNMHLDSYVCELCISPREESLRHLFYKCPFAKNCWSYIGVSVPTWLKPERATKRIKRSLNLPFAMEIIILMSWSIWTKRNAWIFREEAPSVQRCLLTLKSEFSLVIHKAKKKLAPRMKEWLISIS